MNAALSPGHIGQNLQCDMMQTIDDSAVSCGDKRLPIARPGAAYAILKIALKDDYPVK
jgi:hypothetical protein